MSRKGVSPVAASLLILVITVAAAVITYVWVTSYLSFMEGGVEASQMSELLKVEEVSYDGRSVKLLVRNIGGAKATLRAVYVMQDGVAAAAAGLDVDLEPGQAAVLSLSAQLAPGSYTVKVVTARGVEAAARLPILAPSPQAGPPPPPLPRARFAIVSWNSTISGAVGSRQRFVAVVKNVGGAASTVTVRVYDHTNAAISSTSLALAPGEQGTAELLITLPAAKGNYTWRVEAVNATGSVDDWRSFTAEAMDLYLKVRGAIYYTPFESLPSGWNSIGGTWTIVTGQGVAGTSALQGVDNDQGPGGTSAYHWGTSISEYGGLEMLVQVYVTSENRLDKLGFALLSGNQMYTVDLDFTKGDKAFEILYYDGSAWKVVGNANYKPNAGQWYTIYLRWSRVDGSNVFASTLYDSVGRPLAQIQPVSHNAPAPTYIGLVVDDNEKKNKIGLFDNFVLSRGDPRYVTVSGLREGWIAELRDSSGQLVASAAAGSDGVARLPVASRPIITNARITVKDSAGSTVIEKRFDTVVGGDEYTYGP